MGLGTVTQRAPARSRVRSIDRYFVNTPVDALLIGGASLLLYAVFRLNPELATSPSVASVAATLVWGCNYPTRGPPTIGCTTRGHPSPSTP